MVVLRLFLRTIFLSWNMLMSHKWALHLGWYVFSILQTPNLYQLYFLWKHSVEKSNLGLLLYVKCFTYYFFTFVSVWHCTTKTNRLSRQTSNTSLRKTITKSINYLWIALFYEIEFKLNFVNEKRLHLSQLCAVQHESFYLEGNKNENVAYFKRQ